MEIFEAESIEIRRDDLFREWSGSDTTLTFKAWLADMRDKSPGFDTADYYLNGY